ncbi:MAG: GntR family transcriptional regulator [Acidipropionibacterium acidipropionici]|uniref:GntR family transcriptional regulator n=1 Tax=Acidipropionibacterium acidipropionici TaxID=1748 RepID=A0AAC8YCX9_9ACTN|nr:GntR family transcriptional regulator [Acidipropionibacterium acidipropionici]AMS04516.1 GntR family transcriptional regulator [Acidipropionibacterium acidipropionici]AOZ46009.1 GntR family transcriptional regulator [Acidipropionibacterium acidipropionici]AZP37969.1 GntR family transcriptional regulator [Acidipropionibacterium acidipropionici]QCV95042.1 GntR family transcriptional regulator [Acidipropionibacterium acidipropionici]
MGLDNLRIDPDGTRPPFEQLRAQLVDEILARRLPAGMKLPPVRRLAADLGIAANTAARAYKELEAEGYLITRGRNGTVVAPVAAPSPEIQDRADALTAGYVSAMRELGFGDDAILMALRHQL